MSKLYETQILLSINKVLLDHGHSHSFICHLWLLSTQSYSGEEWTHVYVWLNPFVFTRNDHNIVNHCTPLQNKKFK